MQHRLSHHPHHHRGSRKHPYTIGPAAALHGSRHQPGPDRHSLAEADEIYVPRTETAAATAVTVRPSTPILRSKLETERNGAARPQADPTRRVETASGDARRPSQKRRRRQADRPRNRAHPPPQLIGGSRAACWRGRCSRRRDAGRGFVERTQAGYNTMRQTRRGFCVGGSAFGA
jgi:hypothetical protein